MKNNKNIEPSNVHDIKYEVVRNLCITECPYSMITESENRTNVGSYYCSICIYNEGIDVEKHIVKCSHKTKES